MNKKTTRERASTTTNNETEENPISKRLRIKAKRRSNTVVPVKRIVPQKAKCENKNELNVKRKYNLVKIKRELERYQDKNIFMEGVLVFARVRGYRPWPAIITKLLLKGKYEVEFFGTFDSGTISSTDIFLYCDATLEVLVTDDGPRKKILLFQKALEEISQASSDLNINFNL